MSTQPCEADYKCGPGGKCRVHLAEDEAIEIGQNTTTLDYLKVRYQWLGELVDETAAELKRLQAENKELKLKVQQLTVQRDNARE